MRIYIKYSYFILILLIGCGFATKSEEAGNSCDRREDDMQVPTSHNRPRVLPPEPELPVECQGETIRWEDPDAPPPDDRVPMVVAVLYDGDEFTPDEREDFLQAVTRRVDELIDLPVLDRQTVRDAEALGEQHRLTSESPACGQAPPLPSILAVDHSNLVLARVSTWCGTVLRPVGANTMRAGEAQHEGIDFDGSPGEVQHEGVDLDSFYGVSLGSLDESQWERSEPHCTINVWFDHAGTNDDEGGPGYLEAEIEGHPTQLEPWLQAVEKLDDRVDRAGLLGALLGRPATVFLVFSEDALDPWLRVGPTLYGLDERIQTCQPEPGVASYRLTWTISPTGEPSEVLVEPITPPAGDLEAVTRCVADVLEESAWPCTPSGEAERVQVRICAGR